MPSESARSSRLRQRDELRQRLLEAAVRVLDRGSAGSARDRRGPSDRRRSRARSRPAASPLPIASVTRRCAGFGRDAVARCRSRAGGRIGSCTSSASCSPSSATANCTRRRRVLRRGRREPHPRASRWRARSTFCGRVGERQADRLARSPWRRRRRRCGCGPDADRQLVAGARGSAAATGVRHQRLVDVNRSSPAPKPSPRRRRPPSRGTRSGCRAR